MDTTSDSLVFEAIKARLARQESALDELRGRTAALIGVAFVVVSFLGGAILEEGDPGVMFWTGIGLITLSVGISLWITLPKRESWRFSPHPRRLLEDWRNLPPHLYKTWLAECMADWIEGNTMRMVPLYQGATWAGILTSLGLLALLVDLGGLF